MAYIQLSINIGAPPDRVWRALSLPDEVIAWDSGLEAAFNAPPDYPQPGQSVRWRRRSGIFRTLIDSPIEVVAEERLRSVLRYGFFYLDETYALAGYAAGTWLTATIETYVALPVIGALIDGIWFGRATRRAFAASLASLKRHCESNP